MDSLADLWASTLQKILSSCWSDGQRRIRRPTGILLPRHSTLLWKSFGIVEFHVLKGNQSSKVFSLAADHNEVGVLIFAYIFFFAGQDRKSTRLNSSHQIISY